MPVSFYRPKSDWTRKLYSTGEIDLWEYRTYSIEQRTVTGTRTVNYKALRARGWLPTNYFKVVRMAAEARLVHHYVLLDPPTNYSVVLEIREIGSFSIPDWNSHDFPVVDVAWSKLRRKIIDKDFDAGVFAAEFGQTAKMLTSTATRLYKASQAMRKGRLKDVIDSLGITNPKPGHRDPKKFKPTDDLHNRWLEFQYGWKPLVSDVFSAAEAAAKLSVGVKNEHRRVQASSKEADLDFVQPTLKGVLEVRGKAWVIVKKSNPNAALLDTFGLMNPLVIAWEIIPFSFVFDWFVNIGNVLEEITAFANVDVLDGGTGKTVTFSGKSEYQKFPGVWTIANVTTSWYERTADVQYLPSFRFKNKFSWEKAITSLSLIRQKAHS